MQCAHAGGGGGGVGWGLGETEGGGTGEECRGLDEALYGLLWTWAHTSSAEP